MSDTSTKIVVSKRDVADQVAALTGISQKSAYQAVKAMLTVISNNVADGNEVSLVGFGSFYTSNRAARPARNLHTGENIVVGERVMPKFRAGKSLKLAVNKMPVTDAE